MAIVKKANFFAAVLNGTPEVMVEKGARRLRDAIDPAANPEDNVLARVNESMPDSGSFFAKWGRRAKDRFNTFVNQVTGGSPGTVFVPSGLSMLAVMSRHTAKASLPEVFDKYITDLQKAYDPAENRIDGIVNKWRANWPAGAARSLAFTGAKASIPNMLTAAPWWFCFGDLGYATKMLGGNVEVIQDSVGNVFTTTSGKAAIAKLAGLTGRALVIVAQMGAGGMSAPDISTVETQLETALTTAFNAELAAGYTGTVDIITGTLGIGVEVESAT